MKKATILMGFLAASSLNAATINQVIVRQQWPWSKDASPTGNSSRRRNPADGRSTAAKTLEATT